MVHDIPTEAQQRRKLFLTAFLILGCFVAACSIIVAATRSENGQVNFGAVEDSVGMASISSVETSHISTTTSKIDGQTTSQNHDDGTITSVKGGERVFLHIADTHADPYYDYRYYLKSAQKISRDPRLYSKKNPAKSCGKFSDSSDAMVKHWNETSDPGRTCPCGHFGANPPFSVLASLASAIKDHDPEFVIWGGDFTSHYEPGTNANDECQTAKNVAKATVSILNVQSGKSGGPIQHLWVFGNNDVLPKYAPLTQEWLEEFGQHLVKEEWLTPEEYETTWVLGGFYRRNLGQGLCVLNLNSNAWTANQINEEHHKEQIKWLKEKAFVRGEDGDDCNEFLINAHVPLGWFLTGKGHHNWTNLEKAVAHDYCDVYRTVIDNHHKHIVAELYGHINKADVRLMGKGSGGDYDSDDQETEVSLGDPLGDIDKDIGEDAQIVSFTVAGISRRANNDPQFQRITLEPQDMLKKHGMKDIEVFMMKGDACYENAFSLAYSFRKLFKPDFDDGINVRTVKNFVENDAVQRERIERHTALSSMPYNKKVLKNKKFIHAVQSDKTGCELGPPHTDD